MTVYSKNEQEKKNLIHVRIRKKKNYRCKSFFDKIVKNRFQQLRSI